MRNLFRNILLGLLLICSALLLEAQQIKLSHSPKATDVINIDQEFFVLSLDKSGKLLSVEQKSGRTGITNIDIDYDLKNRVRQIGDQRIDYDLKNRMRQIGDQRIDYDLKNRVRQIGDQRIDYDLNNRVRQIGDQRIDYDLKGRIRDISSFSTNQTENEAVQLYFLINKLNSSN